MMKRTLLIAAAGCALLSLNSHSQSFDPMEVGPELIAPQSPTTVYGKVDGSETYNRAEIERVSLGDAKGYRSLSLTSGDSIGTTGYDFQTNGTMTERIINWGKDGVQPEGIAASMVWMASSTLHPTTDDRGTYGAVLVDLVESKQWFPINLDSWERLEGGDRSGFPEIAYLPTGEVAATLVIVSHRNDDAGITVMLESGGPGSGEFFSLIIPGSERGLWPRVAVDDDNVIHVIWGYQSVDPQGNPLPNAGEVRYSRSNDLGTTWSVPQLFGRLDGNGNAVSASTGGDTYQIAANGSNVVVWLAASNAIIHQWYSDNNGTGWLVSRGGDVLWARTYHPDEGRSADSTLLVVDTLFGGDTVGYRSEQIAVPGTAFDLMILDDGTVVGVFNEVPGYIRNYLTPGESYTLWRTGTVPRLPVIVLESGEFEDRAFRFRHLFVDVQNRDIVELTNSVVPIPGGLSQDIDFFRPRGRASSMARWPQFGIGSDGDIFLVYGAGKEGDTEVFTDPLLDEPGEYYYNHTYATRTTDQGMSWSTPQDLTPVGVDAQFATLADWVDGEAYIALQSDSWPGDYLTAWSDTVEVVHPAVASIIEVMIIPESAFAVSSVEGGSASNSLSAIRSIAPNPAVGRISIEYAIESTTENVRLEIVDSRGSNVATLIDGRRVTGRYQLQTDISHLPAGSYFVLLTVDGESKSSPLNVVR